MTAGLIAFHNLPAACFPFTFAAYPIASTEDVDPLWEVDVPESGAVNIPSTGQRVRIVMRFADGTETRFP